jgi:hypothetical protein
MEPDIRLVVDQGIIVRRSAIARLSYYHFQTPVNKAAYIYSLQFWKT